MIKKSEQNTSILTLWKRINQNNCDTFKYDDFWSDCTEKDLPKTDLVYTLFSFKDFFHSTVEAEIDPDVRTCLVKALDFTHESS